MHKMRKCVYFFFSEAFMSRRESREQAFVLLFEKSFQPDCSMRDLISINIENGQLEEDNFAETLAVTVWDNLETIDGVIEKYAIARRMNRISKVSLALLRLAVCEMMFMDDIPEKVSINEAVELCKKYASQDEYAFVNGILGAASRGFAGEKEEAEKKDAE